jgi:predicted house-cleaning noncanonical NTP pyrophosphatase (MazG superfamily)
MNEKLVRDNIPDIIRAQGRTPDVRVALATERESLLAKKVVEELGEFLANPTAEEVADMLEVIEALAIERGITMEEVLSVQTKKYGERGGFEKGYVLKTE